MTALSCDALSAALGGRMILDDVSATFEPGTLTVLSGPNGAGKTTLLRCLARALAPAAGRVLLDGADAADLSRLAYARRVAYLPQTPDASALGGLSVREAVACGRIPHTGFFGSQALSNFGSSRCGASVLRTAGAPVPVVAFAPTIAAAAAFSSSPAASRASTWARASASTSPSFECRAGMGLRSGSSGPITVHFSGSLMYASMSGIWQLSNSSAKEIATPVEPARPVRPMRCT